MEMQRHAALHDRSALETADWPISLHGPAQCAGTGVLQGVVDRAFEDLLIARREKTQQLPHLTGLDDALLVKVQDIGLAWPPAPPSSAMLDHVMEGAGFLE